jgi:hypothetical protein
LEYFLLEDYQSTFVKELDINKIFNLMIDGSTYIFDIDRNSIPKQEINDDITLDIKSDEGDDSTQTSLYTKRNKSILVVQVI